MADDVEGGTTRSVESLVEQRGSDGEFGEVMDLLRASPATRDLSDGELERHARAMWARFERAPVRSFVPILVEREVLSRLAVDRGDGSGQDERDRSGPPAAPDDVRPR